MKPVGEWLAVAVDTAKKVIQERRAIWHPFDKGFNPKDPEHVVALRMFPNARFLGGNRYQVGPGFIVDRLGQIQDPAGCPICGSTPEHDFRFRVRLLPDPTQKPWESRWTYCPRCVTPAELAENEAWLNSQAPRR